MLSKDSEIDTEEEKDIVVENFGQGIRNKLNWDRGPISKKSSSYASSLMSSSVSSVSSKITSTSKSSVVGRRMMKNKVDSDT